MTSDTHIDNCNRRYDIYQAYLNGYITTSQFQKAFERLWLLNRLLKISRTLNDIHVIDNDNNSND